MILRVAHLTGCDYERDHHGRIGRRADLAGEEIERVREGAEAEGLTERRRLLLRAVEEIHADGEIGDALRAQLATELDDQAVAASGTPGSRKRRVCTLVSLCETSVQR